MKTNKIYTSYSPQFLGNITYKNTKNVPDEIIYAVDKNRYIKELAQNNDVVVRFKIKKAHTFDFFHYVGEKLYLMVVSLLKENSKLDKILDSIHFIKRSSLTENYHSKVGTLDHLVKNNLKKVR